MREIKFRVAYKTDERQDTEQPGWVISQTFQLTDLEPGGDTSQFNFSDGGYLGTDDINWDSPDLIWQQYTGLKDKQGKEIYEGDVLGWEYYSEQTLCKRSSIVRWNDNISGFDLGLFDKPSFCEEKVIGNIYENPELVEDSK